MKEAAKLALEDIYNKRGALKAEVIVDAAKDPESPLHDYFDWDDTEAARKHRLSQARQLVRVAVTIIPALSNGPVRQFVSLSSLRKTETGSYLATVDVLGDEEKYAQAKADAIKQLIGLKKRFAHIKEFAPIWAAMAQVVGEQEAAEQEARRTAAIG